MFLYMERNVGRTDQVVRISGGVVLLGLGVNAVMDTCVPDLYAPLFAGIGGIILGTGIIRKCPICKVTGIDTTEGSETEEDGAAQE